MGGVYNNQEDDLGEEHTYLPGVYVNRPNLNTRYINKEEDTTKEPTKEDIENARAWLRRIS